MSKDEILTRLKEWAASNRVCAENCRNTPRHEYQFIDPQAIAKNYDNSAELLEEAAKLIENP
jgi:hypothetical protein